MPKSACYIPARLLLTIAIAGCATPYQRSGWNGGYDDFRITDDTFEVSFEGNLSTTRPQVSRYVLRRAAEVTLAHGFTHFHPLIEFDRTRCATVHHGSGVGYGGSDATFVQSAGSASAGANPEAALRIRCFRDPPPGAPDLIDARKFLDFNFPQAPDQPTR